MRVRIIQPARRRISYGPAILPDSVRRLIERKKGILLDVSLGGVPQERSVSLAPSGDVRHDPRLIPWPLPDGCANTAVVTHVLEYLDPSLFFAWWDELWRVMQLRGIVYVSGPYGGDDSQGWLSDPTHLTRVLETSFAWLDPRTPLYPIHPQCGRSFPRPWYTQTTARVPGTQGSISYNATLQKVDPAEALAQAPAEALKQFAVRPK